MGVGIVAPPIYFRPPNDQGPSKTCVLVSWRLASSIELANGCSDEFGRQYSPLLRHVTCGLDRSWHKQFG